MLFFICNCDKDVSFIAQTQGLSNKAMGSRRPDVVADEGPEASMWGEVDGDGQIMALLESQDRTAGQMAVRESGHMTERVGWRALLEPTTNVAGIILSNIKLTGLWPRICHAKWWPTEPSS